MKVDVLVIGGNPGGCTAAIAAARAGHSVMLLEASGTLGGMNANGAMGFDCATPQALSGIAEEVAARIRAHYTALGRQDPLHAKRADLVWESHVGARVWADITAETAGLTVLTRAVPTRVRMDGQRIAEVTWHPASDLMGNVDDSGPGQSIEPGVVVDASYEADVAAWSGAPFRLGREARSALEPHAGKIFFSNFDSAPQKGHLAHSILPGSTGAGDDAIMAFALRLHCRIYEDTSRDAPHRLKRAPAGYDPSRYRFGPVGHDAEGKPVYFNTLYVLVGGKVLLNRMVHGNNLVGPNRDYVLAHPRDRKALRQRFIDHALGFLYFVQTEGGLPQLGLAHDEFQDNDHLPYLIYVREARRIEGATTLTEADVNPWLTGDGLRPPRKPDAVAIGDWTFESQGCADEVLPGYHYPDGYITGRFTRAPYQIPYGCLLPQGVDNLLVCGGISATHIAAGATRCEAARIQMGLAAGVAAALALDMRLPPRAVPTDRIQQALLARGAKLTYFADLDAGHEHFAAIQWASLRGFVPEDEQLCFHPDNAITWSEFVTATVVCLRIPISVTSQHFENLSTREPCFKYCETLYDLGTRCGVDVFGVTRLADEDPMQEFLRIFPAAKLLRFAPRRDVAQAEAWPFLSAVLRCLAPGQALFTAAAPPASPVPLTRALACAWLQQTASVCERAP